MRFCLGHVHTFFMHVYLCSLSSVYMVLLILSCITSEYMCLDALFHVRYFQSCLALRYEGLVLRELKSVTDDWLHVSYTEWFTFAEHALENKFYAVARKVICVVMNAILTDNKTRQHKKLFILIMD